MEAVRFSEMLALTYQILLCLCICGILDDLVYTLDYILQRRIYHYEEVINT